MIIGLYQMEGIYIKKALQKPKNGAPIIYVFPKEKNIFAVLARLIFTPVFLMIVAIFIVIAAKF